MTEEECQQLFNAVLQMQTDKMVARPEDLANTLKALSLSPEEVKRGLDQLWSTDVTTLEPDTVEAMMYFACVLGRPGNYGTGLSMLLLCENHQRHEDIAHELQQLKDPVAVEALHKAVDMKLDYLSYDEFFGLARKCTWALADIGTPEARAKLKLIEQSDNPTIAGYARKRLESWEKEKSRKGC